MILSSHVPSSGCMERNNFFKIASLAVGPLSFTNFSSSRPRASKLHFCGFDFPVSSSPTVRPESWCRAYVSFHAWGSNSNSSNTARRIRASPTWRVAPCPASIRPAVSREEEGSDRKNSANFSVLV